MAMRAMQVILPRTLPSPQSGPDTEEESKQFSGSGQRAIFMSHLEESMDDGKCLFVPFCFTSTEPFLLLVNRN